MLASVLYRARVKSSKWSWPLRMPRRSSQRFWRCCSSTVSRLNKSVSDGVPCFRGLCECSAQHQFRDWAAKACHPATARLSSALMKFAYLQTQVDFSATALGDIVPRSSVQKVYVRSRESIHGTRRRNDNKRWRLPPRDRRDRQRPPSQSG